MSAIVVRARSRATRGRDGGMPLTVTDPACGAALDPAQGGLTEVHNGITGHYCSTGCRDALHAMRVLVAAMVAELYACAGHAVEAEQQR